MSALAADTAMIMAAGMGTRMRPLTNTMPKPLVAVAGKPLIDHALDSLSNAGVRRAIVNVHYMADALDAHLKSRETPSVVISDEREQLLETGGGMVKAHRDGLLPETFFCLNADNIWLDGSRSAFHELSGIWDGARMDALLLLVPHANARNFAGKGDFDLDAQGRVSRRGDRPAAPYIYTGIQLVSQRLLRDAPKGKFSTNILWDRALAEGRLFGAKFSGQWFEVGTPEAIEPTQRALREG